MTISLSNLNAGFYAGDKGSTGGAGSKGDKGDSGQKGELGSKGDKGDVEAQGNKGEKGDLGSKGEQGAFGGASFEFTYTNLTSNTEPGDGFLRFNNASLSSATLLFIDQQDGSGANTYGYLQAIDDSTSSVKGTFTIKLFGYIIPNTIQKELTAIKKYNSRSKIIIGLETTTALTEFVGTSARKPVNPTSFIPAGGGGGGGGGGTLDPATLVYLNTNVQKLGTYVNPTTVTFASGWLAAPTGLPATSISNFSLFCNGALIELAAISSFTEASGITTLIIDPSQLGYSFDSADEIIAIGKFNN